MSNQHYSGIAQRGLTLIELMIALTIGLFLVGAVSALFVNTRNGFDYSNEVARIQETGRFALEAMSRDIRMAGYNGCGRTVATANVVNNASTNPLLDFSTPIRGYEGGVDTLPAALSGAGALSSTDAIILIGASNGDIVVQSHNPPAAQINTNTHTIKAGEILFITDCSKATIFQMTGPSSASPTNIVHNTGTGSPGNCTKFLGASCPSSTSYTYQPGAMVLRLSSSAYFIGNSTAGNGMRSLYAMDLEGATNGTSTARELLVGVDNMQIVYGSDTDSDGAINSFATADNVSDWSKVVSVKVSLLVRSTSTRTNLAVSRQPYVYMTENSNVAEQSVTPTDGILRRVFTETIVARNRTM